MPCSSEGLEQEVCQGSDRVTRSQMTTGLGYFQSQPLRDTVCPFWKPPYIPRAGVSSGYRFSLSQVTSLVSVALTQGNALFRCTGKGAEMGDSGLCPVY